MIHYGPDSPTSIPEAITPSFLTPWPQKCDYTSPDYGKAITTGNFALLNARVTITPTKNFTTYLAVDNIADQKYEYVDGYPMPGRALSLGVEYSF